MFASKAAALPVLASLIYTEQHVCQLRWGLWVTCRNLNLAPVALHVAVVTVSRVHLQNPSCSILIILNQLLKPEISLFTQLESAVSF